MRLNYNEFRNRVMKNEKLFKLARFLFTPIRITREYVARRKMANEIIQNNSEIMREDLKIIYFGIPEHNNLGDMAQTYCTREWIELNYPEYKTIEVKTRASFDRKFYRYLQSVITDNDIFIFQSGYCTREKNSDHLMHKYIAERFPDQKMVILPQTVKLKTKREVNHTREVFEKCTRLLFVTRDRISYNNAQEFLRKEQITCFPDIVTSLIGKMSFEFKREGALLCVRNDDEKFYSDDQLNELRGKLADEFAFVERTDTNSELEVDDIHANLESVILEKIGQFAKYRVVITDRYHGTIFSLIANTPVIVIKSNDHKVTSGVDWFDGVYERHAVQLANDLQEALELAKEIKNDMSNNKNDNYLFFEYYRNRLKYLIDCL